jgi:hypothetical protein
MAKDEPNLVGHYFNPDNKVYDLVARLMEGAIEGNVPRFRGITLSEAEKEVRKKRSELDASTFPFARDVSHIFWKGNERRVLLLTSGTFYGSSNLDTMLGFDLGTNPWRLFEKHARGETIDQRVSLDRVRDYLSGNLDEITSLGYRGIDITGSFFFYLPEIGLGAFRKKDGEIDMSRLIPMLIFTENVGLDSAKVPSQKEYVAAPMPFTSYRLKASLAAKINKRLAQGDLIRDWASHRIVVATEDEARELFEYFKSEPVLGANRESRIEHMKYPEKATKDYYENPKENGYRAFHIPVVVHTKGHNPVLREIQIVDRMQYYFNEVDPNNPTHHKHQERKRNHIRTSGAFGAINADYRITLDRVFGANNFFIEAKRY